MARGTLTFKQSDLTRALKGARAAGLEVARVRISKDGAIEMDAGKPLSGEVEQNSQNLWDKI
jgi:hypothetical protein